MRRIAALLLVALAGSPALGIAEPAGSLEGIYLEARSAQVFIGGCVMSSEAHTMGREAILTWHVTSGEAAGQRLDGLSLVAVIAGDQNLGLYPDGPRRSVLYVNGEATAAQQEALAGALSARFDGLFGDVAAIVPAQVRFEHSYAGYRVDVDGDVRVSATEMPMDHTDLVGCGQDTWYEPFVGLDDPVIAVADEHEYRGAALGTRWSDPHGQSAYFGQFRY